MSEFGVIGLGVMGKSLARNLADKGFTLSLYNRFVKGSEEKVAETFIIDHPELSQAKGFEEPEPFVNSLDSPRKILLMVNAGRAVDLVIEQLLPHLQKGDILIDGGNSHFRDTEKRQQQLAGKGIHFLGCGISGGEEGALHGPSIMPGGDESAYQSIAPFLEAIAAKDASGKSCCTFMGKGGAGHFVKMVHNGIEYAEMQLIADCSTLLLQGNQMEPDAIAAVFEEWNTTDTSSYLLEISVDIFRKKNKKGWLLDQVLDKAGNKGTGSWTTITMAELGIPASMIASSLFARYLSAFKKDRVSASNLYDPPTKQHFNSTIQDIHQAYKAARIINHHQGFSILKAASIEYDWDLNLSETARIWTNGCIIRSELMEQLIFAFKTTDQLLLNADFVEKLKPLLPSLSSVAADAIRNNIHIPVLTEAQQFMAGFITAEGSSNVIQAQRDYFGAHTYQSKDDPQGPPQHTNWSS